MKICDLHAHSVFSDGTYTPEEIIDASIECGLSAVALCDHNTVDGLERFILAAKGKNIEAVAGTEFSVDYNGTELHLLGLFIPESSFGRVASLMSDFNERKRKSNMELIESLKNAGYEIDYESIKNSTPKGNFNRSHIGIELTRKGYTQSIKHALSTVLSSEAGYYKAPERISIFDAICFIKSIGAVSVLAHPFLNLKEKELEQLLPAAKDIGLVGIECVYSEYDEMTTQKSFTLADKYGLKYSGGSDFHGINKSLISLGIGKGNLMIPYDFAEKLKTAE